MTRIAQTVFQEKYVLLYSVLVAIVGLAMRSCHAASESAFLPLCSSTSALATGFSGNEAHCAGCFVAVTGLLLAAVSVVRLAIAGRMGVR